MSPALDKMKFFDLSSRFKKPHMKAEKGNKSIGTCYGLIEMQRHSVGLQSWMDWSMEVTKDNIHFMSAQPQFLGTDTSHTGLTNGWADKNNLVVAKIDVPFVVYSKDEVDFVMAPSPFLRHNLHMPSGMVNFKHTRSLAFFIYLHTDYKRAWDFEMGDSLLNFAPMSDRPIKVHNIYDKEKYEYYSEDTMHLTKSNGFYRRRSRLTK
tara:strand:- start:1888 stop:2508 length:621 start_codon:yes stop_codon:yes gene_type:complete